MVGAGLSFCVTPRDGGFGFDGGRRDGGRGDGGFPPPPIDAAQADATVE
jgi:hypothetical protein